MWCTAQKVSPGPHGCMVYSSVGRVLAWAHGAVAEGAAQMCHAVAGTVTQFTAQVAMAHPGVAHLACDHCS